MAINLLGIQPHKVSTDLSGYITYLYGPGGAGKTTFGVNAPKPLLIAFEKGYNALPGVIAQDVTTWGQMKEVLRELKKPEVKEVFSTIIIDTVDIASTLCEKYICSQLGIENIGDGGWTTNGWSKVKKEWEQTFRTITMEGYALIFISHSKTDKKERKDGTSYDRTLPSCSKAYNEIIKNMADIQGYIDVDGGIRKLILRSDDDTVECKCRFAQIKPVIDFSYDSLVTALNDAIDKEAKLTGNKFVTAEKETVVEAPVYDFEAMMAEFQSIVGELMTSKPEYYQPRITEIVNSVLGKGKKVGEMTIEQADLLHVILGDVKELQGNNSTPKTKKAATK